MFFLFSFGHEAFTAGPTVKARPHVINPDSLSRNVFDVCALIFGHRGDHSVARFNGLGLDI